VFWGFMFYYYIFSKTDAQVYQDRGVIINFTAHVGCFIIYFTALHSLAHKVMSNII
jgi:hypothetical protein